MTPPLADGSAHVPQTFDPKFDAIALLHLACVATPTNHFDPLYPGLGSGHLRLRAQDFFRNGWVSLGCARILASLRMGRD